MDQAQSTLAAPSAWYLLPGLRYALTNALLDLGERAVVRVGYATSCWNVTVSSGEGASVYPFNSVTHSCGLGALSHPVYTRSLMCKQPFRFEVFMVGRIMCRQC